MEPNAVQSARPSYISVRGAVGEPDPDFAREVSALVGKANLALCYQCGVCSASCPTVDRMAYGPRRIMHMIHLGMAEDVLRSPDIWLCVSCYSCAARCPQGVQVADVMATLRNLAIRRGVAKDREATFSQVFVNVLSRYGRMYEPEVLLRYDAAGTSLGDLVRQAGLGLRMLKKGKIGLRAEHIAHPEEISALMMRAKGNEAP